MHVATTVGGRGMKGAGILFLVAFAPLAGCAQIGPPTDVPSEPALDRYTLLDCDQQIGIFPVEAQRAASWLPEGFYVRPIAGHALLFVGATECQAEVDDAPRRVREIQVGLIASAPPEYHHNGSSEVAVALLLVTDDEASARLLRAWGADILVARIDWELARSTGARAGRAWSAFESGTLELRSESHGQTQPLPPGAGNRVVLTRAAEGDGSRVVSGIVDTLQEGGYGLGVIPGDNPILAGGAALTMTGDRALVERGAGMGQQSWGWSTMRIQAAMPEAP